MQIARTDIGVTVALSVLLFGAARGLAQGTNRLTIDELRRVRLPDVTLERVTSEAAGGKSGPQAAAHLNVKGNSVLSRPLYPYPETAVYKGSGAPNKARALR